MSTVNAGAGSNRGTPTGQRGRVTVSQNAVPWNVFEWRGGDGGDASKPARRQGPQGRPRRRRTQAMRRRVRDRGAMYHSSPSGTSCLSSPSSRSNYTTSPVGATYSMSYVHLSPWSSSLGVIVSPCTVAVRSPLSVAAILGNHPHARINRVRVVR